MTTNPPLDDPLGLVINLARDAAADLRDDMEFAISHDHFISDDRQDYNNGASDMIRIALAALDFDADDTHSPEYVLRAFRECLPLLDGEFRCSHYISADFDSPLLDLAPDIDDCPNLR